MTMPCEICDGIGEITLMTTQIGGEIVDEERVPCPKCGGDKE